MCERKVLSKGGRGWVVVLVRGRVKECARERESLCVLEGAYVRHIEESECIVVIVIVARACMQ